ncbi:MAG TPA: cyclic-di-AMP receptor [Anaerolineaceae bacterium]|nr:cyclic-di-AMP receptor [Anaerolineaceae bacterium]
MKLMIIIVRNEDDEAVIRELVQKDFRVTRMASTGGFLRRGNSTLLVGVEDDQVDPVTAILRRTCCSPEEGQHRATVFVVNMREYIKV